MPTTFCAFILYHIFLNHFGQVELKNYEFYGAVTKIHYDIKRFPTIEVNNKEYYLCGDWNFKFEVELGDTIVKNKNSYEIKLIKKNSGQIKYYSY